jgi:hypothetical protein
VPDAPSATAEDFSAARGGAFLVGRDDDGRVVCGGGLKRLDDEACEIKRMYVIPEARGRRLGVELLVALEDAARSLGYAVARLDTGVHQPHAEAMYREAGYADIGNFNRNPFASFGARSGSTCGGHGRPVPEGTARRSTMPAASTTPMAAETTRIIANTASAGMQPPSLHPPGSDAYEIAPSSKIDPKGTRAPHQRLAAAPATSTSARAGAAPPRLAARGPSTRRRRGRRRPR